MGERIVLRDHSQPCEHGSLWSHWINVRGARWWHEPEWVGGREIVLERLGNREWREVVPDASSEIGERGE